MFDVEIKIIRKRDLLDPQGKAIEKGVRLLGFENVFNIRLDKSVELEIDAVNKEAAAEIAENICKKLLANPHMEEYSYRIIEK